MHQTASPDGTRIAYETRGTRGQPLILVSATLQGRTGSLPLAEALAGQFTVYVYDRRGRGDSGDTPPYAVERELDDLAAVIEAAGGSAALYGHSSGAGLVLHAGARGLPVDRIVLHEPPFATGTEDDEREEAAQLAALLAEDRRAEAVRLFVSSMGLPDGVVDWMVNDPATLANAPTILYDPYEVMSVDSRGGRTPAQQAAAVKAPALVLAGTASPQWMVDSSREVADALPYGRLQLLDGHDHVVPAEDLAPVIAAFLTEPQP
jgi:pimeloyl-ACP methyl ester carboxylesterase